MYYLIALGFGLITFGLLWVLDRKFKANISIVLKVTSIVLIVLFFVWYLLSGGNMLSDVMKLDFQSPVSRAEFKTILGTKFALLLTVLAVWFFIILHGISVLVPFFKDKFPIAKKIEKLVAPILLVFDILVLPDIVYSYTNSFGFSVAGLLIAIELGLILGRLVFSFVYIDRDMHLYRGEVKEFILAIFVLTLFSMPHYVPHVLFGYPSLPGSTVGFSNFHRVYIYVMFIYIIGLTLLLRGKEKEYCRMVLLYITFVAMINYSLGYGFIDFIHPWSWPLHICNTAMYILPLALTTKSEKIFYFTFFINILGAFLAAFMPSYSGSLNVFANRPVSFWLNHVEAACMPLVCVLTGTFNRPTKKQFFYSMVGFCIYYILAIVLNTVLTAYRPIYVAKGNPPYGEIDFFFINTDFVAKKVHMEFLLYDFEVHFKLWGMECTMYPLYQAIYFGGFILMSIGMWFIYAWIFKAQDALHRVHEKYKKVKFDQLALCAKYNKEEVGECMSEISKDKLVISHFGKQYSENAPFAVRDINFEAKGGEIVGFLGPNGAGKSTTIKAIVGIHLPTEGTIEVNGYDVVTQPVQSKGQLGFVPDHYALYENLTGREYLNYIADLYDVSKESRDAFLEEFLETLSMKHAIDNKIQTYSHGMKQKIAIMASIIHNPKLWILDEPLTGLDPVSIYQVKQCLKKHAEKGNIVFFSSHLIDIVEKLCDRIIIISDHQVKDIANVHELVQQGVNLEQYYMDKTGQKTGD